MLHRPTSENDPADWFAFAQERLRGCDLLREKEGITALGIEALQEAVERFLKGFLIGKGWRLEKSHDLQRLLTAAAKHEPEFSRFQDLEEELTLDFFAQHYPVVI
jgi:HEPN domain-containing protein